MTTVTKTTLLDALNHIDEHGDLAFMRGADEAEIQVLNTVIFDRLAAPDIWRRQWVLTADGIERRATLLSVRTANAVVTNILGPIMGGHGS